ncbi:MAG: hypothetical protein ACXACI_04195 [Candidatus Hodarchaeales archaeon]
MLIFFFSHLARGTSTLFLALDSGYAPGSLNETNIPYVTQAYSYAEFDSAAVSIVRILADKAVDFDEDGEYDHLAFQVEAEVQEPTVFSVLFEHFQDDQGNNSYVGDGTFPVFYPGGIYNVTVYVLGAKISEIGSSSPWASISGQIRDEDNDPIAPFEIAYQTQAYNPTDFPAYWIMWSSTDKPPSIGGLYAATEPMADGIASGESLQFQIAMADDQPVQDARLFVNGVQTTLLIFNICQDCEPWRGYGILNYTFRETGIFEVYAVLVDNGGQFSGKSNFYIVRVSENRVFLDSTVLGVVIFMTGLFIALGIVIIIVRTPNRRS